jgi:hypothetical protein
MVLRMNPVNHQIRLAARPVGLPARSDWELATEPVPAPGPREFVVAVSLSVGRSHLLRAMRYALMDFDAEWRECGCRAHPGGIDTGHRHQKAEEPSPWT